MPDERGRCAPGPAPTWARASHTSAILVGEVHVWAVSLDIATESRRRLEETLSDDERDRATRFRRPEHGYRWATSRGLLREILGRYLCTEPSRIRFRYDEHEKPSLGD